MLDWPVFVMAVVKHISLARSMKRTLFAVADSGIHGSKFIYFVSGREVLTCLNLFSWFRALDTCTVALYESSI